MMYKASFFVNSVFCFFFLFFFLFSLLDASRKIDEEDGIYGGSTDDESSQLEQSSKKEKVPSPLSPKDTSSSDRDTEDELRR